jgi:hypothetical protein
MSRTGAAAINYTLTAYAQGLANDIMAAQEIANAICPIVPVTGAAGGFKKFSDRNSFSVYNTQRGIGGTAKRILFDAADGNFNCEPQALEVTVDQHERDLADAGGNPVAQQLLDQGKIRALVNSTALSHVDKIITFVNANVTAEADRGAWSNDDVDPIDQLDEQLDNLTTDVGSSQFINLVLSTSSWRVLRNHKKVKARCSGVQVGGITREQLASILMIPVNVVIGSASKLTSKEGQTVAKGSKSRIVGSNAYLTYSVPSPTPYDPSALKCFTTGSGNVEAVRTYQDPSGRFDVHAVDWSEDIQLVSALAIRRLAIS